MNVVYATELFTVKCLIYVMWILPKKRQKCHVPHLLNTLQQLPKSLSKCKVSQGSQASTLAPTIWSLLIVR